MPLTVLNRGDQIGSLEPGKIADFVIHDCDDYRELAYFFGIEHPWQVYAAAGSVIDGLPRLMRTRMQTSRLVNIARFNSRYAQKIVDAPLLVFYYPRNTGKEVIQKYMSSYHSEVAAA